MVEVVYNQGFGGFSFSEEWCAALIAAGVPNADYGGGRDVCRHDPRVVKVVRDMIGSTNGAYCSLKIAVISGTRHRIDEYDGLELVQTPEDIDWVEVAE